MFPIRIDLVLIDGLILSLFLGALVAISFFRNPRIWLNDFPSDIRERAAPMSPSEKRTAHWLAAVVIVALVGAMAISAYRYGLDHGALAAMVHAYLVFQLFNAFDLVVIDWGILLLIDPAKPPIEGTEHAPGWRDFRFHAVQGLNGVVLGIPLAALAWLLVWLAS